VEAKAEVDYGFLAYSLIQSRIIQAGAAKRRLVPANKLYP
jgi:hypothetical protein